MKCIYLCLILLFSAVFGFSQSTTLTISQVYGGGGNSGSVYTNDFIEIFNKSSSPISLNGYSVQYASATGTSWNKTNLTNVTLQPGQYYLVQEAMGAGGTTPLPTPDAIGTIAMSGTAFKVALVSNTTILTGGSPSSAAIVDFVGCGTADFYEGAVGPAPSNSNSIFRKLNGCQDTQNNASDFTAATTAPRNTASTFNPCNATCTVPTQKPTNIRYGGSSGTSMTVYFTRGNGTGSLVLCRAAGAVNTTPTSGVTYTTSTVFGSSTPINSDNYPVFSTTYKDVNAFTLTNLTVGTKYYFSVFEYNDPGKCYTSTGLVDSFTVGGNILNTNDIVFVGWDNTAVNPGEDKLYMTTMVDINKGTRFSLVNSRFESGATANTRTNKWYGGGDDPYQNPYAYEFEYAGSTIAKGSVISVESNAVSGFTNFTVNGTVVPSSNFTVISTGTTSNFMSVSGGDQVYIVQGKFTPYGTAGTDRYNLLTGNVIHGFTTGLPWIPFTSAVSASNTGTGRESRIPPQILCTAVEFNVSGNTYGAYKHSAGTSGTKDQLVTNIRNNSNWIYGAGTNNADDVPSGESNVNNPFTVLENIDGGEGTWIGNSSDWFDCNNWIGQHVPDSITSVQVTFPTSGSPFFTEINVAASSYAKEYNNIANTGNLYVHEGGLLTLIGTGKDKLVIDGTLMVDNLTSLRFETNSNSANDTIWTHGNFANSLGFTAGFGTVVLDEARFTTAYSLIKPSGYTFYNLVMNNTRNVNLTNPVRVSNNLNLKYGYLNPSTAGTFTLSSTATITSPSNVYSQSNKGYFNSFVNGKMYYDAAAASGTNVVFPIGKYSITDTAYAPVELTKTNTVATTYNAEYFPAAYSDLTVDIGQLDHVSSVEHWLISSSATNAQAQVTLSWRPKSQVGDGTNNPVSFDSLMVAHYFDPGSGTPTWSVDGGSAVIMTKAPGYNFNYGLISTISSTGVFSPFTLGTRGKYNALPVKLLSFTAALQTEKVALQWLTAEEQDVWHYEVEKSADGVHFDRLLIVNAFNTAGYRTYNEMDMNPIYGWNYYRLRIIDKAGKASFSTITKVWNGKMPVISVYPNPATKEIKINLPVSSSIYEIGIVNSSGQLVKQLTSSERTLTINIESLSKGVYFIRILNCRQAIARKFTKQ